VSTRRSPPLFLVVLALVLTACGGGNQPSTVTWRNVTLQMPDGWYLFEEEETRLSISNADIGPEAMRTVEEDPDVEPRTDVVAMFLTYEPRTVPGDWRTYAEQQDATIESDEQIVVGGDVPATRIVFSYVTDDVPLREMVVVIPSRSIVVLAQPVPTLGQQDGPEVFLDHVDTFIEVLDTADLGAPVLD
jgi:hypothetical protein